MSSVSLSVKVVPLGVLEGAFRVIHVFFMLSLYLITVYLFVFLPTCL